MAHLECDVDRGIETGDHVIVPGAVLEACAREGVPLGFCGGRFSDIVQHGAEPEPRFF